jgi:hypothetical protein
VEIAPNNPDGYLALSRFYLATGQRPAEAHRLAERLVELQPTAQNQFTLSAACLADQDSNGARAALQAALRIDPRNPQYIEAARALAQ